MHVLWTFLSRISLIALFLFFPPTNFFIQCPQMLQVPVMFGFCLAYRTKIYYQWRLGTWNWNQIMLTPYQLHLAIFFEKSAVCPYLNWLTWNIQIDSYVPEEKYWVQQSTHEQILSILQARLLLKPYRPLALLPILREAPRGRLWVLSGFLLMNLVPTSLCFSTDPNYAL